MSKRYVKSKYKYVSGDNKNGVISWIFRIEGETKQRHETERKAAIAADKYLLYMGKEPVNILVRKQ